MASCSRWTGEQEVLSSPFVVEAEEYNSVNAPRLLELYLLDQDLCYEHFGRRLKCSAGMPKDLPSAKGISASALATLKRSIREMWKSSLYMEAYIDPLKGMGLRIKGKIERNM